MGSASKRVRLIVNADDFGLSHSINQAVIRAHCEGILTSASLMVNGAACAEAVQLARQHPKLGVGLHLTLVCGAAALRPDQAPALVNASGEFSSAPVRAGFYYWRSAEAQREISSELQAQFERFKQTGLPLDHVNGHLHFHLHPSVFDALLPLLDTHKPRAVRLTRDPFRLNARLATGRLFYRASHALIFGLLSKRAKPALDAHGIRHTDQVFGLLQNGRVDEGFLLRLLPELAPGNYELYSHPSLDEFTGEFSALVSPRARELVQSLGIELIRHGNL